MYTLPCQRRLHQLGHTNRMADGRIPKDLLYGELATGLRRRGRPHFRFKDVCKRDMKACNINTESWEAFAVDRTMWKQIVSQGLESGEKAVRTANEGARAKRAPRQQACTTLQQPPVLVCQFCIRSCSSRIGLFSHSRRCSSSKSQGATPQSYRLKDANNNYNTIFSIICGIKPFKHVISKGWRKLTMENVVVCRFQLIAIIAITTVKNIKASSSSSSCGLSRD